MLDALVAVLNADDTFTDLLTGGVYLARDVQEIGRQNTPNAYDANEELKPCALVRWEADTQWGPHQYGARAYITLWYYQRFGCAIISQARLRGRQLLHRQQLTPPEGTGFWRIDWANDLPEQSDPDLVASMEMSRFSAYWEFQR